MTEIHIYEIIENYDINAEIERMEEAARQKNGYTIELEE